MKYVRFLGWSLASWMTALPCVVAADSRGATELVRLPAPRREGSMSIEEALVRRRSVRAFRAGDLTPAEMGQLLFAAQGITDRASGHRAAPSAGATFPLEAYVVSREGVYRYVPPEHALRLVRAGDHRRELAAAALHQDCVRDASIVIALTAVSARTAARYGARADRYVNIEAGHAAENVLLQAVALGLGAVPVGAFDDVAVQTVLQAKKDEAPVYLIPVGRI